MNEQNEPMRFFARSDYEYNYTNLFFFERKYYSEIYISTTLRWFVESWWLSIVYAIVYIALVHIGQRAMKNREKFHLYRSLIAWNICLAVFSILGAVRILPNFLTVIYNKGIEHSVCVLDYNYGVTACWTWLFVLSKLIELVDTAFIILRKQKLIFLHWYHHATVLVYCWYSVSGYSSSGRWFVAMNYSIHALMYSYYAFRAMRFKIPMFVNIFLTSIQISQMLIGISINVIAFMKKSRGESCQVSYENIYWSFFMYFTYFVLFFHFFRNAYLKKGQKAAASTSMGGVKHELHSKSPVGSNSKQLFSTQNGIHYNESIKKRE